ncbi:hypothetical protein Dimus_035780, partial [Dionaea muscipula]
GPETLVVVRCVERDSRPCASSLCLLCRTTNPRACHCCGYRCHTTIEDGHRLHVSARHVFCCDWRSPL